MIDNAINRLLQEAADYNTNITLDVYDAELQNHYFLKEYGLNIRANFALGDDIRIIRINDTTYVYSYAFEKFVKHIK